MAHEPDPLMQVYGLALGYFWKRSGMKVEEIAAAVHTGVSHLYMIRRGFRFPEPKIREGLDRALGADGLLVILGKLVDEQVRRGKTRRGGTGTGNQAGDQEVSMRRRHVLQDATAALAAIGAAGPVAALDMIRTGLDKSIGRADVPLSIEDWEHAVVQHARSEWTTPPAVFLSNLGADLVKLQQQIDREDNEVRERDLCRFSGTLSAMVAYTLVTTGQFRAAGDWWQTAKAAADASGDPATRTWVRAQEAVYVRHDHRPLRKVVELADEVQAIGGAHAGTAEALGAKAKALVLMGRTDEAVATVRVVGNLFEQLPAAVTAERDSTLGFPEARLRNLESWVHSRSGDLTEASRSWHRALKIYPTAPRIRAYHRLHQAWWPVREGDIDGGMRLAQAVIESLPLKHRTAILLADAFTLLDSVPTTERTRPSVTSLRDLLETSAAPTT